MFAPVENAIIAMFFFGTCDFLYKCSARVGIKPLHFLTAQTLVFWLLILTYAYLSHRIILMQAVVWNALAGMFMFVSFFHFFKSLEAGSVSINAPIFRLSFMITATLAIVFLHESLSLYKVGAALFAIAAVWLLLGASAGKVVNVERRSLFNLAIATLALGTTNFFHKVGVSAGVLPETAILVSATVFCLLATFITFLKDRKINLPLVVWKLSAPAGLALASALLFLLHALANGPASVLVPISQLGFVVPAVLGIALLRETVTPRKIGGLAAAVAALAIFATT